MVLYVELQISISVLEGDNYIKMNICYFSTIFHLFFVILLNSKRYNRPKHDVQTNECSIQVCCVCSNKASRCRLTSTAR